MFSAGEAETTFGDINSSDPQVAAGRVGRCHVAQLYAEASIPILMLIQQNQAVVAIILMLTEDMQATAANCEAGVVPCSLSA